MFIPPPHGPRLVTLGTEIRAEMLKKRELVGRQPSNVDAVDDTCLVDYMCLHHVTPSGLDGARCYFEIT